MALTFAMTFGEGKKEPRKRLNSTYNPTSSSPFLPKLPLKLDTASNK
jgi:hypothetical protein